MKNYYVILTGGKNNAGDHLIKYRAKLLFKWLRSDREIIDLDGWKPFSKEELLMINNLYIVKISLNVNEIMTKFLNTYHCIWLCVPRSAQSRDKNQ